jgi:AraC-like DNA-binding protein/mannose-6-phosphate isomerase-like protein (cupin superfamily)
VGKSESIKKKEGFQGQKAVVIPRTILSQKCNKNEIIGNLYITDLGYYPKAQYHYRERPQGADQHILIYCHEGAGKVTIKETEYQITSGDFIIIPIKTAHSYEADEKNPWTIYWVHFKGSTSDAILSLLEKQTGSYKGFVRSNEIILSLFNEMYNQLARGYGTDNLMYTNMCLWHFLTTFIYNSKYHPSAPLSHKDPIDVAIDFLSKNVEKPLTLEEIARKINLSPSHFSFTFKKKTGFSPIEYFNHLKVQKACQYLLFTTLRIKEIAQELGIEDPYYFSRLFTKIMGTSPNEYRDKKVH